MRTRPEGARDRLVLQGSARRWATLGATRSPHRGGEGAARAIWARRLLRTPSPHEPRSCLRRSFPIASAQAASSASVARVGLDTPWRAPRASKLSLHFVRQRNHRSNRWELRRLDRLRRDELAARAFVNALHRKGAHRRQGCSRAPWALRRCGISGAPARR